MAAIYFAFCPAIPISVCLVLSCSLLRVSPVLPILFLSPRLYWPLSCCSCHISFSHWFLVPVLSIFPSCVFLIQSHSSVKLHSLRFLWGSLFQPFWHHNFRRFPVLSSVLNNCLLPPGCPGLIQEGWTTCSSIFSLECTWHGLQQLGSRWIVSAKACVTEKSILPRTSKLEHFSAEEFN